MSEYSLIDMEAEKEAVSARKRRFSPLKLGVLAIFAWVFFKAALCYGSEEMSSAAVLVANADLAIHEYGHILLCGGGEGLCYAGGTILQLLAPLSFILYFLFTRQYFSASLVTFWLGENIIGISHYMATAIDMEGIYFSPWGGGNVEGSGPRACDGLELYV